MCLLFSYDSKWRGVLPVRDKNICKFIQPLTVETLNVACFVLEAKPEVMGRETRLEGHYMFLISQGSGLFRLGDGEIAVTAGSLVFGFKGEWFRVTRQENCNYLYIRFDGTRAGELFRRFDIRKDRRVFENFSGIIPLWQESLSRAGKETADLAAESMLLYTFSRLPENRIRQDPLLAGILDITEERFRDPKLSLGEIARELSYSTKYLSHYFKQKMGVGYSEYLRTMRIKYAVTLFEQGIVSVKNVALLSGFTDPLYFSTVFKNALGVSPSEYKASLGSGMNSQ